MSKCKEVLCFECSSVATHHHHVIPKSLGGQKTIPLCDACHGLVHDRTFLHHKVLIKKGLANRRKKGLTVGHAPFGYKIHGDTYVEDPEMFGALSEIMTMRADGYSIRKIADMLNKGGAYPRRIHKTTVERVLTKAKLEQEQAQPE